MSPLKHIHITTNHNKRITALTHSAGLTVHALASTQHAAARRRCAAAAAASLCHDMSTFGRVPGQGVAFLFLVPPTPTSRT